MPSIWTKQPPLVVDLDGTLLHSDLLMETGLVFLRDHPHRFFVPLLWFARGKATLKQELAQAAEIDASALPYDAAVIEYIERARQQGRQVILATASHRQLADRVATHLGLFDAVIATDHRRNLSAESKRDALISNFGERGFDYAGNSRDDLPVWRAARQAIVVNAPAAVERKARALGNVAEVIKTPHAALREWRQALRLHHWIKNLLVFVPLLTAHKHTELALALDALFAFIAFGLCASSVYVLNDLFDLSDDRCHARKRLRPFASGRLSIQSGLMAFPLLLMAAFGLAIWQLPFYFTQALAGYYALTLVYSLWIKRQMIIDVITLATLYTFRIIAGAAALDIPLSFWLLAFSMFIFLSLALVKRHAELFHVRNQNSVLRPHGRGYFVDDLQMVASLGASSGYIAVMVLALYINDNNTAQLYRQPEFIWLACPLLLAWISRVWMLAHRGEMNEDPVIFAVRDRASLCIGALTALVFWAAA